MDAKITLHMHSRYSDGSYTVHELLEEAERLKMSHIAITDHDTLANMPAIEKASAEAVFSGKVLGGCEISCVDPYRGNKVHIIALHLDHKKEKLETALLMKKTLEARKNMTLWQIDQLIEAGLDISHEQVLREAEGAYIPYKQHVMFALYKGDYDYSKPEHMARYKELFKGKGIAAGEIDYPSALDAVCAVKKDGGIAIVAHPGQSKAWPLLDELVEAGLDGIEVYHPDNSPQDELEARAFADKHGLFKSAGSDFHGKYGLISKLDAALVAKQDVDELLERLF
ncbi:MAG: PHP domain-containing protein [Coriobacteriia bacterium]|nr:PHP domain-containing protein [Coriobacteriia bacterium]